MGGPGEHGTAEKPMEETSVEGFKDLVEVVVVADGGEDALAAARLAYVLGLAGDGLGGDVAAIAVGVNGRYGFLVELGEEDMGNGLMDGLGCVLQQIGEANMQSAFAKTDGGVQGGEAMEADVERRNGRARAKIAVLLFKDGDECGKHYGSRLT